MRLHAAQVERAVADFLGTVRFGVDDAVGVAIAPAIGFIEQLGAVKRKSKALHAFDQDLVLALFQIVNVGCGRFSGKRPGEPLNGPGGIVDKSLGCQIGTDDRRLDGQRHDAARDAVQVNAELFEFLLVLSLVFVALVFIFVFCFRRWFLLVLLLTSGLGLASALPSGLALLLG